MSDARLDIGFAEAFDLYRAAGWARSFPLPVRKKDPPPVGITGRGGQAPNPQTLATFRRSPWNSNLGIAMPQDLIGIDVDQYGTKKGAEHLATLEDLLGVCLPPTARSSSRGADNPSGIRLYRVPPGLDWKGELCPDVEIISWHDRYAVVWPSVHPEGREYQWYDVDGGTLDRPPVVAGDHPDLPWQFIAHATKDPDVPADYEAPEPRRETIWHPKVTEAFDRFSGTGSLHANARTASMALARYEQLQFDGATSALDELGVRFITTVESNRERRGVAAEWGRLLSGARYKARTTESTVLEARAAEAEFLATIGPSNGDKPPPAAAAVPVSLEECVATFQHWLHLPDPGIVVATLAAAAANLIPGDPLWLLIVGPPSSAKTECVSALTPLPYVHPAAKVTEASLLSGTPPKERLKAAKGGLLRQIGDFGIILLKDFTSVLAQNRDTRAEAIAALREIFDGRWDRPVGTGGGVTLSWSGKCGLIGGCTPTIDRHHAVMGTLGERFLFYRVNVDDPGDQASRRLGSRRRETDMRRELHAAVAGVLAGVDPEADIAPDPGEDRWLVSLAVWTAKARTPVERDGYSREVVVMPESEGPARIVTQLGAIRDGLDAIAASLHERWAILHKLAWDAMPAMRREVLQALRNSNGWAKRAELMDATDIPRAPIERELEDLVLIGLADRQKAGDADNDPWRYRLSTAAHKLWPKAAPICTGGPVGDDSRPSSKEESAGGGTYRGSSRGGADTVNTDLYEAEYPDLFTTEGDQP